MPTINKKVRFSLEASLTDLTRKEAPSFNRQTMMQMERWVDGSLQLYPINAFWPAIADEDGAFILEPEGVNLATWNQSIDNSVWVKGDNVIVLKDKIFGPDGDRKADRVVWTSGIGLTQSLQRSFALEAGSTYTLWSIIRLVGGSFSGKDQLKITGAVSGVTPVQMSDLNDYQNRYQIIQTQFTTTGRQPVLPDNVHTNSQYNVTNITTNTVTLALTSALAAGDLVGGQISFNNTNGINWTITGNTAQTNGSAVITVDTTNVATFTTAAVTTASKALLAKAAPANVLISFYVESTVSIDMAGIQLEQRPFRTSMIFQESELRSRARSLLTYRHSPFDGLKTFGIYFHLKEWRGDGNIFQTGNVEAWIQNGRLYVKAGDITVSSDNPVPKVELKVFIQIAEENSALSVYINGILEDRVSITNFVATVGAAMELTTVGLRSFRRFFVTDQLLTDGQSVINQAARNEVASLFDDTQVIIDPVAISCPLALIPLAAITVPPPALPLAKATITGVNTASNILTVDAPAGFVNNQQVSILRSGQIIALPTIITINAANFTINTTAGVVVTGDTMIYGNVNTPGQASVRFPYDPIDPQTITAVDTNAKQLTLERSALSFIAARAFVASGSTYQDKAEVVVQSIDLNNRLLVVDDVSQVSVGDVISQPVNELWVDIDNYYAGLINTTPGLSIGKRYINGLLLYNTNPYPVIARPYIKLAL